MDFKLSHRVTAALVFLIAVVQFFVTAQPSVSFWDPGELSAAAYLMQVPHPPGGPLFLLVGRVFYLFPLMGNIGFRMNALSLLSSAFSVLFLYLVAVKLIANYRGRSPSSPLDAIGTYAAAAIGALAFSFSDTFWFSGVESNYFAASTFLFSCIVWLLLIWNEKAEQPDNEKYILMMAYLVGLSAGVHLMSVLTIVTVVIVIVVRRYVEDDRAFRTSAFIFLGHALFIIAIAMMFWGGQTSSQPPSSEDAHAFDVKFIVTMGVISLLIMALLWKRVFNRNSFYFPLMVGGAALLVTYPGIVKFLPKILRWFAGDDNLAALAALVAILAALTWLAYWSSRNKKNTLHLVTVAIMVTLVGVTTYTMIVIRANVNPPMNENAPKTFSGLVKYLDREQYGDFPIFKRRYSQEGMQRPMYTNYGSDLSFFLKWQMNHMFNRYVGQNYIGRESANQDAGVDWTQLWAVPFAVGLLGLFFHFRKDWKMASAFLILFIFMGYLTTFYQNQQEPQPRDRDYFYAGAYFVFAVWIALGVKGLFELIQAKASASAVKPLFAGALLVGLLFIPGRMLQTNYSTHDRSKNWAPWDFSYNMLQTCAPNAILFTNGDNDTFPLWYLQAVEGIRRDVRVVCLSLLNTNWYISQLKNQQPYGAPRVAISLTDQEIDRIDLERWEPKRITIPVSQDAMKAFNVTDTSVIRNRSISFVMPNTLQFGSTRAIRVQDIMVLDIIQQNNWKRPIYFAVTCGEDSRIGTSDFCRLEGLAVRLVPQARDREHGGEFVEEPIARKNLLDEIPATSTTYQPGFLFRGLDNRGVFYDENASRMIQNYRFCFLHLAFYYLNNARDREMGLKTIDRMQRLIPVDVIPMDYRMEYDIANIYYSAGDTAKFTGLAGPIEQGALASLRQNPRDATSPYSPFKILSVVYDRTGQYAKMIDLLTQLRQIFPRDTGLVQEIQRYQGLLAARRDTSASHRTQADTGH